MITVVVITGISITGIIMPSGIGVSKGILGFSIRRILVKVILVLLEPLLIIFVTVRHYIITIIMSNEGIRVFFITAIHMYYLRNVFCPHFYCILFGMAKMGFVFFFGNVFLQLIPTCCMIVYMSCPLEVYFMTRSLIVYQGSLFMMFVCPGFHSIVCRMVIVFVFGNEFQPIMRLYVRVYI